MFPGLKNKQFPSYKGVKLSTILMLAALKIFSQSQANNVETNSFIIVIFEMPPVSYQNLNFRSQREAGGMKYLAGLLQLLPITYSSWPKCLHDLEYAQRRITSQRAKTSCFVGQRRFIFLCSPETELDYYLPISMIHKEDLGQKLLSGVPFSKYCERMYGKVTANISGVSNFVTKGGQN